MGLSQRQFNREFELAAVRRLEMGASIAEVARALTRATRESAAVIEQFCRANGQILLPILNLIENTSQVVETAIHEIGHQTLEQILILSAEHVAGPRTPGKAQRAGFPGNRMDSRS